MTVFFRLETDERLNQLESEVQRLHQVTLLQKREIAILRLSLEQAGILLVDYRSTLKTRHQTISRNIAPMRPVEELTDEAAALDETLNMEQIGNYLSQPRVRAEDVTLSPDEIARANQKRRNRTLVDPELRRQIQQPLQLDPLVLVFVVVIVVMVFLFTRF